MTYHNVNEKHGFCVINASTRLYGSVNERVYGVENDPVYYHQKDFEKCPLCLNKERILEM